MLIFILIVSKNIMCTLKIAAYLKSEFGSPNFKIIN